MKFEALVPRIGGKPTAKCIRDSIARFEELGESGAHSPRGWILAHILNHCVREGIGFVLTRYPHGGYFVKRWDP